MRHHRPRINRQSLTFALTAVLTLTLAAQPTGYIAQVYIQTDQMVDDQTLSALKPADRAKLAAKGIQVVDQEHLLRAAPRPLGGHWVQVGTRRLMTDQKGFLNLSKLPATRQNLKVYAQVGDKTPIGTIPALEVVPAGQTPQPSILKLKYKLKPQMNPGSVSPLVPNLLAPAGFERVSFTESNAAYTLLPRSQPPVDGAIDKKCKRAACATGNAKGCCIDYDGPLGDGKAYNRSAGAECLARGSLNFTLSTCFLWSFVNASAACANEGAYPWNPNGPTCYRNHKYRNCQNLDESDFSLTPASATLGFGESTTLTVRNNTPSNSTCLEVSGPGKPTLKLVTAGKGRLTASAACGGYQLDHFSDAAKKHYETLQVKFTAPAARPAECEATYHVVSQGGGLTRQSDILVQGEGCGSARLDFSLKGTNTTNEDIQVAQFPYTGHKVTTETMSYTGSVKLKVSADSDETNLFFEPSAGSVTGTWTVSEKEQGTGVNAQNCRYDKTITFDIDVSGTQNVMDEAAGNHEGAAVKVTLDGSGGYRLNMGVPGLTMKGTQLFKEVTVSLSPQCTAAPTVNTPTDREQDLDPEFEDIVGHLANRSVHKIAGSKPVTFEPNIGVKMKGTLKWTITW